MGQVFDAKIKGKKNLKRGHKSDFSGRAAGFGRSLHKQKKSLKIKVFIANVWQHRRLIQQILESGKLKLWRINNKILERRKKIRFAGGYFERHKFNFRRIRYDFGQANETRLFKCF